jgi:cell division protease FtsH
VNWGLASSALAPADRAAVSYTFFRDQVQAGNVVEITSTGDTIEGRFRNSVRYPPDDAKAPAVRRSPRSGRLSPTTN